MKVAPQVAQAVKNLPPVQETWVRSLSQEDLLEKEIATHSSILAWRIPWAEEPGSYSPWGGKESDMTEWLQFHFHFIQYKLDQLIRSIRRCSPVLAFQDFMQLFSFTYLSLSWVCKFNHYFLPQLLFFQKFHGILHHYGLSPTSLSLSCGIIARGKTMNFVGFFF